MSREIEDRLRAALSAKAERIGDGDLRPPQLPVEADRASRPGRRFRRSLPWLAPVLAAAAVAVVVVGVTGHLPDRHTSSTNSAAGRASSSLPPPVTSPAPTETSPPFGSPTAVPQQSAHDAVSLPPPVITLPESAASGDLKNLPSAVLGSTAYWPTGHTRGFGSPHPSELNTNGDPSGIVLGITWQDWGASSATGVGRTYLPKPGGGFYPGTVPIELQATKLGRCGSQLGYSQLYFRVPDRPGGPITGPWQLWAEATDLCQAW
jgi:hypothetical protein